MKCVIKYLIILAVPIFSVFVKAAEILPSFEGESNSILKIEPDEVAIFGYGSLMHKDHLERPADDPYTGPFIVTKLKGFKRSWSAHCMNKSNVVCEEDRCFKPRTVTYLNIEPDEASEVNGVLFVCSRDELDLYDSRESPYNRIRINDRLGGVTVVGGDVYTYTAKPENFYPAEYLTLRDTVIRLQYVEIIEEALEILGEAFAADYFEFTQPVPAWLVYDVFTRRH